MIYSIENKLDRLAEIRKASNDYEHALVKYLNFQKLNKSNKVSINVESNLFLVIDSNLIEEFLSKQVNTTFSNLKKLEVI
jgi:hypothetical protein